MVEGKTILCVDDEPAVLRSLRRLLGKEGYRIITAPDAQEGLRALETADVHLVVSDERMPGIPGTEFLEKVRERWPSTVRVILSGYADGEAVRRALERNDIQKFLHKPWDDEELKALVRELLGGLEAG